MLRQSFQSQGHCRRIDRVSEVSIGICLVKGCQGVRNGVSTYTSPGFLERPGCEGNHLSLLELPPMAGKLSWLKPLPCHAASCESLGHVRPSLQGWQSKAPAGERRRAGTVDAQMGPKHLFCSAQQLDFYDDAPIHPILFYTSQCLSKVRLRRMLSIQTEKRRRCLSRLLTKRLVGGSPLRRAAGGGSLQLSRAAAMGGARLDPNLA